MPSKWHVAATEITKSGACFHVAKQRATKQPGLEVNDNFSRTQTLFIRHLLAELYVPLEQPEIHRPAEA
jgi:hypothetical protein